MKKYLYSFFFFMFIISSIHAQNFEIYKKKGDQFWLKRDITKQLIKAIDAYKQAIELTHDKNEKRQIWGKISYGFYLLGDSMTERKNRKAAFYNGYISAEKVLEMDQHDPKANYFHVINKLSYKDESGIFYVILYLKEFNRRMNLVMKQDKYLLYGGPQRVLARMIHFTPFLLRSKFSVGTLHDAETMLKEAINTEPRLALNRVFLADIYLDMNKKILAKKELIKVLKSPVNEEFDLAPENRLSIKMAKSLMLKHF